MKTFLIESDIEGWIGVEAETKEEALRIAKENVDGDEWLVLDEIDNDDVQYDCILDAWGVDVF